MKTMQSRWCCNDLVKRKILHVHVLHSNMCTILLPSPPRPPPPALQVAIKKTFGTSVMKKIWINLTARVSALSGFSTVLKIQPIETCSKM